LRGKYRDEAVGGVGDGAAEGELDLGIDPFTTPRLPT
jgi:hypothetical protein